MMCSFSRPRNFISFPSKKLHCWIRICLQHQLLLCRPPRRIQRIHQTYLPILNQPCRQYHYLCLGHASTQTPTLASSKRILKVRMVNDFRWSALSGLNGFWEEPFWLILGWVVDELGIHGKGPQVERDALPGFNVVNIPIWKDNIYFLLQFFGLDWHWGGQPVRFTNACSKVRKGLNLFDGSEIGSLQHGMELFGEFCLDVRIGSQIKVEPAHHVGGCIDSRHQQWGPDLGNIFVVQFASVNKALDKGWVNEFSRDGISYFLNRTFAAFFVDTRICRDFIGEEKLLELTGTLWLLYLLLVHQS
mmetsp:Transcript_12736/g.27671  ORF Transcript_12736/g.27671 Transcript_12736/m.27671 type:complete len:303 (+) Transcript_12736:91-999(+)